MAKKVAMLRRAAEYLDSLAQGVDPIQGRPVREGDALTEERLKTCFRFVVDVLREEIAREESRVPENETPSAPQAETAPPPVGTPAASAGNPAPSPKPPEASWQSQEPDAEVLLKEAGFPDCLPVSEEPLALNQAVRILGDAMTAAGLRRLTWSLAVMWMKSEDLLVPSAGGEAVWTASPRAKMEGFLPLPESVEEKEKSGWVICTAKAQRFLAAHLAEILRFGQAQWDVMLESFSPEKLAGLTFSQKPLSISKVAALLNTLLPLYAGRKLTAVSLSEWLEAEGYLTTRVKSESVTKRVPTKAGKALGITQWTDGRDTPLYSEGAQRYLADHIPDMVEYLRLLRKPSKGPAFYVPPGLKVMFSAKPIGVGLLQQRLDEALMASGGVPLQEGLISLWLYQEGYLENMMCDDGKTRKLPTNEGEAVGLQVVEENENLYVRYTEPAQRFVAANLAEIAACRPRG